MKVTNPRQFKTVFSEEGRECTACGEFKKWEDFTVHSRSATGRTSKCKKCKKEDRPARNFTREKYCAKVQKEKIKKSNPLLFKARAIRSKLIARTGKDDPRRASTPVVADIVEWLKTIQPFVCYYSGVPITLDKCHVDHKEPFDRGGTNELSNLCLTSPKMNTAKGGLNEKEFKSLLILIQTWEDKGEGLLRRMRQGFYH